MGGRLEGLSFDTVKDRLAALAKVVPEAFVEGKLDYDMLMELLGEEAFDDEREKYRFEWKGKAESLRLAQKRSTGTLRPDFDASRDWDRTENVFIEGDNLEVLKLLQAGYLRKVKMIYIDPPYNTGRDFVYADDFADPVGKYKEVTGQGLRANPELSGRYHSNWLSMMYPRLKLAKTLLRDDGVIFISIDDNEVHNLRKLCDEVFGEENFIAEIIWKKRSTPPNDKVIGAAHDYIIAYARNIDAVKLNLRPRTEEQLSRYKNPDNHSKGPWMPGDLMANVKGGRYVASLYFPIINPNTGEEHYPSSNGNWRFNRDTIQHLLDNNEIYFGEDGKGRPKLKRFLNEVKDGMTYTSLWDFVPLNTQGSVEMASLLGNLAVFDNPKPMGLIKELCALGTERDSVVLDFFSGSGTTAHAVMKLNAEDGGQRKFICIQLPELVVPDGEAAKAGFKHIADIGQERIRRAGDKVLAEWKTAREGRLPLEGGADAPPDVGFRAFRLDSTNLIPWDDSPLPTNQPDLFVARMDAHMEERKPDRRDLDVVYEIFLKYGIPLTEKLSKVEAEGHPFYAVGENGYLFIALTPGLTVELVEQVAKQYTPGTMIFADACFPNDDELTNTALALEKFKIEFRWI